MYRSVTACDSSSVRAFDSRAKLAKVDFLEPQRVKDRQAALFSDEDCYESCHEPT